MNLKVLAGIYKTKNFIEKSVKSQNQNIILDISREGSNWKTLGIKDTNQIERSFIKKLLDIGYSWNTVDNSSDRGRAVDIKLLNPITGKIMTGSSSGTAINVLYGLNTVGVGTDGGGSVLAPAIALNLYSILLAGIGEKGRIQKKSTDQINFIPGIGLITQNFSELKSISKIFLDETQEKINYCCVMNISPKVLNKLENKYQYDILGEKDFFKREEMINFLTEIFKKYKIFIYLEKDVDVDGVGDSVLGVMGEKAKEIQKKANKNFIKVLNMLDCTAITIPQKEIGTAIVVVAPKGKKYLESVLEISEILLNDERPNLYKEYFLNYPLKEIDSIEFDC